jgi:2-oxo-4-hydroxy-4-carboxy--5-ureidoimidazoline (OHCU) decarboxylase
MIKNFLVRKLVESKMKDVPKEQREMILTLVEKNPELFQKIATEVEVEMKSGKDQMAATMAVMQRHQSDLQSLMANSQKK